MSNPNSAANNVRCSQCKNCVFCRWTESNGKEYQTGCQTGQLENYKKLKHDLYPDSEEADNPVYRLKDEGRQKYFIVSPACVFSRTEEWANRMLPEKEKMSVQEIRDAVFAVTPFLYLLTTAYDGDVKRTLRSVRHVLNSTVKPQAVEIVSPYDRAGESKNLSEMVEALRQLWKSNPEYQNISYNVRQMQIQCGYDKMLDTAIRNHRGFFYVLSLEEGVKISPDFIESVKHQVVDNFLDFHILSLENQYKSALWAGVLYFGEEFQQSRAFIQNGTTIVRQFNPNYVKHFFPEHC